MNENTNHEPTIPGYAVAAGCAAMNAQHWNERNRLEETNAALVAALERLHSIVEFRQTMGDLRSGSFRSGHELDAAMDQAKTALKLARPVSRLG